MSEKDSRTRAERREGAGAAAVVEPERGERDAVPEQGIDRAIGQMERLYRIVTGQDAPPPQAVYAPIPAERDPGEHLDAQVDRLLRLLDERGVTDLPIPTWSPPVAVWESAKEIVVRLDLPGVPRDQVEINFEQGALQVRGHRPPPTEASLRFQQGEAPLGAFRRTLMLPHAGLTGDPTAHLRDGVLEVRIPRTEAPSVTRRNVPIG
jgi:HSP20 family protein